jgi:hypothetical protein
VSRLLGVRGFLKSRGFKSKRARTVNKKSEIYLKTMTFEVMKPEKTKISEPGMLSAGVRKKPNLTGKPEII